jgi:hypothetical protein
VASSQTASLSKGRANMQQQQQQQQQSKLYTRGALQALAGKKQRFHEKGRKKSRVAKATSGFWSSIYF